MTNRRNFFAWLLPLAGLGATLAPSPALPRVTKKRLESPKGAEATRSLRRVVSAQVVAMPARTGVAAGPNAFAISGIQLNGGQVTLTWLNGSGPFQVWQKASLGAAWAKAGAPTMLRTITLPASGPRLFFQVEQQVALLSLTQDGSGTHLVWVAPTV